MIYAAVDPGAVEAAIAVFSDGEPLLVDDLAVTDRMIDPVALTKVLRDLQVARLVVENVHSMPKQGVSSSFRFGVGVGIIHGVAGALHLPTTLVTPQMWKGFHRLGPDKEKARALAISKWPAHHGRLERKKDVNRAEALLIGDWYHVRVLIPHNLFPQV